MSNQNPPPLFSGADIIAYQEESKIWKKIKETPVLPVATLGCLGIVGYRLNKARARGGMKLSFFLIHTRLAAQGFAVAILGSMVLYSLGERFYNSFTNTKKEEQQS